MHYLVAGLSSEDVMWIKPVPIAVMFLLGTGFAAIASPYYDAITGSAATGAGQSFAANGAAAASSFQVNSSGTLSEVEIAIQRTSTLGGSSGSIIITLNADNGLSGSLDAPGNALSTLGTIADTAIPATNTKEIFDFENAAIAGLSPSSTYWIEVAKVGTATTKLVGLTDTSAPTIGATNPNTSSPNRYATAASGSFTSAAVPPTRQLCVSGDNSCASDNLQAVFATRNLQPVSNPGSPPGVPEPESIAMLGTGLIALGWCRRRTQAKQAMQ